MLEFEQIFKNEQVKLLLSQENFLDFFNQINPLIGNRIELNKISLCPWNDYQEQFLSFIVTALTNPIPSQDELQDSILPKLKGVYFCLGDDGRYFSIHGSLYYNEIDWAANADFDFTSAKEDDFLQYLSEELTPFLQQHPKALLNSSADTQPLTDLIYLFSAFTILKAMETINNNPYIANASIAMGYSDGGDELIFGHFSNGKFIKNIQIVPDGHYETPSSAPTVVIEPIEPRGPLWKYLQHNYSKLIKGLGLMEQFIKCGEDEAERISKVFQDYLVINRCSRCQFIKKTPRARLCLNCGEFLPPDDNIQIESHYCK